MTIPVPFQEKKQGNINKRLLWTVSVDFLTPKRRRRRRREDDSPCGQGWSRQLWHRESAWACVAQSKKLPTWHKRVCNLSLHTPWPAQSLCICTRTHIHLIECDYRKQEAKLLDWIPYKNLHMTCMWVHMFELFFFHLLPVFPEDASITVCPGLRWPCSSAHSITP